MTDSGSAPLPTPPARVRTRAWRGGVVVADGFELAAVGDHLAADADTVVWVDLCTPDRDQLLVLAGQLDLHELAVEDALGPHQRPKLDVYDTHQFLSVHAVALDPSSGELDASEIDAFVDDRWIITIRKDERFAIDAVVERWDRSANLAHHGVGFLLYGLLDLVVDEYVAAVEVFDEYYDEISEALFDEQPLHPNQQRSWFAMRRSLLRFHRLVVALREAVGALMRHQHHTPGELQPYYQDVYDHVLHVSESSESLRELAATIAETNIALRDFRQNQIVKQVTSWAAIIAVPTLITGYYGMNVPYPGSGDTTGVVVSTALAAGAPAALFVYFRRKDWL